MQICCFRKSLCTLKTFVATIVNNVPQKSFTEFFALEGGWRCINGFVTGQSSKAAKCQFQSVSAIDCTVSPQIYSVYVTSFMP